LASNIAFMARRCSKKPNTSVEDGVGLGPRSPMRAFKATKNYLGDDPT